MNKPHLICRDLLLIVGSSAVSCQSLSVSRLLISYRANVPDEKDFDSFLNATLSRTSKT